MPFSIPSGKYPYKFLFAFFCLLFSDFLQAQQSEGDTIPSGQPLPEVEIRAFEQKKGIMDVPASINRIDRQKLGMFSPVSIVPVVNTTPGVRMEERSPGSYRFNIRGSSLRSPFGVRNVKVYFNDIPITDPGGQTYLNGLGYYNFHSMEIVKGPASSLYGAGTGGALLIESMSDDEQAGILSEYATGSYGLQNIYAAVSTGSEKLVSRGSFQHQQNDGYRNQSALRRDVHNWTGLFKMNKKKYLKASYLYSDLFYETPGGLTRAEYDADPKASRPAVAGFPGAEEAKASIRQRMFLAGVSYTQQFAPDWENKSVLYGMYTELRNAAIRNYGKNSEPHVGGRTLFTFTHAFDQSLFRFIIGGEWQEGFSSVAIHKNVNGNPDSLRTYDEINNRQQMIFSQTSLDLDKGWSLIAGASWNGLKARFERFTPAPSGIQRITFDNQVAPRVAVMKKTGTVKNGINIFSGISRGFSPPSRDELFPTGGAVNPDLNAEKGTNYDLGFKARFAGRLYVDMDAFIFAGSQTIVVRKDSAGGDYYTNAGKTDQHGIETYLSYPLVPGKIVNQGVFWISHTWHDFHYKEFKQLNADFSNNQMPGNARHTVSTGFDATTAKGLDLAVNYYHSGMIPLNDANTAFADPYDLIGVKIGIQKWIRNEWRFRFIAGADNLLNERYSLGNDINAAGGRYYNAAPGRNYYISLLVQWASKKILL